MRSLRLFRPNAARSAERPEAAKDDGGLMAFASETAPEAPQPGASAPLALDRRARLIIGVLGLLVIAQAVPTALWLKSRLGAGAAGVTTLAAAAPPAPVMMAAPCEPAPASGPSAAAAPAPAAPVPAPPPAMVAGMVSVAAPVPMQVYAKGKLVGTTEAETFMMPVGTHELEFRNDAVGYRARRSVTVQAGRTSSTKLDAPAGTVHVNAVPWAEVWIDNQRVGETPIGNLAAAIGSHEIVFRHPQLGERRTTVLVTLKEPLRVSMDLRKK
jgi:hypothetical protein